MKWKFKSCLVGEGEEKEGELLKPRKKGGGGWLKERSEKRRWKYWKGLEVGRRRVGTK